MQFKTWLLESQEQEFHITEPYYRIVSDLMYGATAKEKLGDEIAPETYWTPRWDAVLFMIRSLFLHSMPNRLGDKNVKIYETQNAIMKPAPIEHKWSFKYGHDAGEAVLVKLLDKPKILYNGKVNSPEVENLINQSLKYEPPVNHEIIGVKSQLKNGQDVFISPNYKSKSIEVVAKDGWRFKTIKVIKNIQEWNNFEKETKFIDWDSDQGIGLMYFFHDIGWE